LNIYARSCRIKSGKSRDDPAPAIGKNGDIAGRKLVPVKADNFIDVDRPLHIEGAGGRRSGFCGYIPQMGQDFGYRYGKFAGFQVSWDFVIMPFQNMSQGRYGDIVVLTEQAFPAFHGHLHDGTAHQFIQPVLGVTEQEDQF